MPLLVFVTDKYMQGSYDLKWLFLGIFSFFFANKQEGKQMP